MIFALRIRLQNTHIDDLDRIVRIQMLSKFVIPRQRFKPMPHEYNVGIAIINHPLNHPINDHKWVVQTIKNWWFKIAIPTLFAYSNHFF